MSSSTASELDSLPGLDTAKRVVRGLAAGSPVQAVLFYGIEGSGKADLARALSKAWLCTRPVDGGACGECQACRTFDRGKSADVLWLTPKGGSRIIKLAAISPPGSPGAGEEDYPISAQVFLRTPPMAARTKVVVLEDADRLNAAAANSLLKILEEPPEYGRFILLTEAVGVLPPTILSRCVAVACEVPKELEGFEPWILELAGNAYLRAAELQRGENAYRPLYDFAAALPSRRIEEAVLAAEQFGDLADGLEKIMGGARFANTEALRILAIAWTTHGGSPEGAAAIIEAHRRIQGNANAGSVFDALFSAILR